jgi:hypothetical protein
LTLTKFLLLTYIQDPDLDLRSFPKLDPDPHSHKKLDPDQHKVNTDPKHWCCLLYMKEQVEEVGGRIDNLLRSMAQTYKAIRETY